MSLPTLRGQLTFASMATTFVALLLTAGALLVYELNTWRQAWVEDLQAQADLIARTTAAALVFDDPKAANENLALLDVEVPDGYTYHDRPIVPEPGQPVG